MGKQGDYHTSGFSRAINQFVGGAIGVGIVIFTIYIINNFMLHL